MYERFLCVFLDGREEVFEIDNRASVYIHSEFSDPLLTVNVPDSDYVPVGLERFELYRVSNAYRPDFVGPYEQDEWFEAKNGADAHARAVARRKARWS